MSEKTYTESEVKNILEMGIRISSQHLLDNIDKYKDLDKTMARPPVDWIGRTHSWVIKNLFRYMADYYSKWDDDYLIGFYESYEQFPMDEYHSIPFLFDATSIRREFGKFGDDEFKPLTYDEFKANSIFLEKIEDELAKQLTKDE